MRKLAAPIAPIALDADDADDADDAELLGQVIGYYHEMLKQSPELLAYLDQRGIRSDEAIDRFRPGFANRMLGLRLPAISGLWYNGYRDYDPVIGQYLQSDPLGLARGIRAGRHQSAE